MTKEEFYDKLLERSMKEDSMSGGLGVHAETAYDIQKYIINSLYEQKDVLDIFAGIAEKQLDINATMFAAYLLGRCVEDKRLMILLTMGRQVGLEL